MLAAHSRRAIGALLLVLEAGCATDSTAPGPEGPPPPASRPSEGLWTSDAAVPAILRLSPDQLQTGGRLLAATSVTTSSATLFPINSIAFDADGTMWIASQVDARLIALAPAALSASGSSSAAVTIDARDGSLELPSALAFDRHHALWVANSGSGTIVRYDAAQLVSSGAPLPAVVLSGVGRPRGLAFDARGALWVTDGTSNEVLMFAPEQLATSGSPSPMRVLGASEPPLFAPTGLAFDGDGNLWVANLGRGQIVAFGLRQIATGGAVEPDVTVTLPPTGAGLPTGLAFDGDGSLWVMSADGALVGYDRSSIGRTGQPTPRVEISLDGHTLFWSLAFWPRPAGLPLN